jgi:hypothetical protein
MNDDELFMDEVKQERNKEHVVDLNPEENHPHWKKCDVCGGRVYKFGVHTCEDEEE